jgi:hypothetical protein
VILRKKHILNVYEKSMPRRISGQEKAEEEFGEYCTTRSFVTRHLRQELLE